MPIIGEGGFWGHVRREKDGQGKKARRRGKEGEGFFCVGVPVKRG